MTTTFTMRQPALLGRLLGLGMGLLGLQAQAQTARPQATQPKTTAAIFTPNNVVVVQAGSGSTANAVTLQEYSSTAAVGTAVALPSTGTNRLTLNSTTLEGSLTRSEDRSALTIGGYDVTAGSTITLTNAMTPALASNRSVAGINFAQLVGVLSGSALNATGNHRAVVNAGLTFYSATSSGGAQYYLAPTSATQLSTAPTNLRSISIYDGRVYISSGSNGLNGIGVIGTGILPTASSLTTSTVVASPNTPASAAPSGFAMVDQDATEPGNDVLYFVDQRSASTGGGLYKYSKVAGVWTANGLLTSVGLNHVAARRTATGVELYVTSGTSLYYLTDNTGYNASLTGTFPTSTIATAATGNTFRGVAFAPLAPNTSLSIAAGTFPTTTSGSTSSSNFTLANSSAIDQVVTLQANGPFTYTGTNPVTVPANGNLMVTLNFAPTATNSTTGTNQGQLLAFAPNLAAVTSNFTGAVGTPTSFPSIAVTQGTTAVANNNSPTFAFPGTTVVNTSSASVTFTITNSSTTDDLTVTSVAGTTEFKVSPAITSAFVVAKNGGTQTFSVVFAPTTTTNPRTGIITINSNAKTPDDVYKLNLSGTAVDPNLTVGGGAVADNQTKSGFYANVTIKNNGTLTLNNNLTVSGALVIEQGGTLNVKSNAATPTCYTVNGAGTFTLNDGGTLNICDPAGITLTVTGGGPQTGSIRNTGLTRSFATGANYVYNGVTAQVTGSALPTQVRSLRTTNANAVSLSGPVSVKETVTVSAAGNLALNGQSLTLLSDASGTALVVNSGAGLVTGGTATVQRYINSTNELGYRHYSSPVSNTTLADLSAPGFTPTFNPAYNSSATPGTVTPFPTVFGYDQSRIATVTSNFSAFDKGWFSPFNSDVSMVLAKGYSVNAPNTALVDFVGTLNSGPISTGTLNRGSDPNAGWQLVGNPYPAPIDWSTITASQRPGMDAAVYVFESAGQYGGSYRSNVNGVGGNGNTSPLIVSGSGCFVRVSTPNGTGRIDLTNANRVTTFGPQPSFGRSAADLRPQVTLTLQGAAVMDDASVYFQAGATAGKDVEFDASKLANPHGLNLSSVAGGEALAINGLPALGTAPVLVPLSVTAPKAGSYSLKAGALANLVGTTVTLVDALTGTRTALTAGTLYNFSLSSTSATGRFVLEFRPSGALATTAAQALSAQTQLFPNPASGSFRVQLPVLAAKTMVQATLLNTLGQTVLHRSLSAAAGQAIDAEFDVRALAPGVYTLRLNVNGTSVSRKVMVE